MRTKKFMVWSVLLLLLSCGDSNNDTQNTETSANNENSDSGQTEFSENQESNELTEWEILEQEYPLLYGEDLTSKENLTAPLNEFAQKINSKKGSFEKIDDVFNYYKNLNLNQEQKDTAFFMYVEFLESIQPSEDEMYWSEGAEQKLAKKYGKYGLDVYFGEGMAGLTPNMYKVSKKFSNDISPDLKNYVGIDNISDKQMFDDGGLIIPWNEYANYVLELEEYVLANTENRYYEYILLSYSWNLETLMWGTDNSSTTEGFGDQPRKLDDSVSKTYDKLISDQEHKTGLIIKEHKKRLEETNFGEDWESRWSPTPQEIETYLGIKSE